MDLRPHSGGNQSKAQPDGQTPAALDLKRIPTQSIAASESTLSASPACRLPRAAAAPTASAGHGLGARAPGLKPASAQSAKTKTLRSLFVTGLFCLWRSLASFGSWAWDGSAAHCNAGESKRTHGASFKTGSWTRLTYVVASDDGSDELGGMEKKCQLVPSPASLCAEVEELQATAHSSGKCSSPQLALTFALRRH